jgi:hypothetical protein
MTDYERGYRQGYADSMNWKTQNYLEHLPGRQELVIDCPRCGHCCPQRPWVGLTDEDIACMDWESFVTKRDCANAIEAKLREKNGD